MNDDKKIYMTPEAEFTMFGEDVIQTSGFGDDNYETDILPDYYTY